MQIRTACRPGHYTEAEPEAFYLGDRRVEVVSILDRWLATEHAYFKVRADDGATYILRHDEGTQLWEMAWFDRGDPRPSHTH